MKRYLLVLLILSSAALTSGCVRRIVTIDSQPQGAEVYFDRKLVGNTPCEFEFLYYGGHHLELVKEGYANLNTALKLKGPIYEYFPLSVFSELLIPRELLDQHNHNFELERGKTRPPVVTPIQKPQPDLPPAKLEKIKL